MPTITALSVAEKPSVARALADILGQGRAQKRNGRTQYNPIFETLCQMQGQNVQMHITSVTGHLMEVEFAEPFGRKWNACKPLDLFELPIVKRVKESNRDLKMQLEAEARKCQWLILWLDCDAEGENIAFEVMEVCQHANRHLQVFRAHFSALIPREILRAINGLVQPNRAMSEAVDARQEVDLRLGAAFTRFQTQRFQERFEGLSQSIISYGPCQFPTLGFIVNRFKRIQNFQSEFFWGIALEYCAQDGTSRASFSWDRGRLYDRAVAVSLAELCVDSGFAIVTNVQARPQVRYRPLPMNTVELQRRAARFLHMPSERAMQAAESLYQRGIISYPRTETDMFSSETDLLGTVGEFQGNPIWGNYSMQLVENGKFQWPRQGSNTDNAHPPIYPAQSLDPNSLQGDEKGIYELVTKHFLACCSKDAKGQQTSVNIHMGEEFTVSGLMITERNWLEVYNPWESWSNKTIPTFAVGQEFVPSSLMVTEGRTEPPPLLSESDLIKLMDSNGIGTDATIAEHIKKIQERGYVERIHGGSFRPTVLGLALVDGYDALGLQLSQPLLRQAQERDCKLVARNQLNRVEAISRCLNVMKPAFEKCLRDAHILDEAVGAHFASVGSSAESTEISFSQCGFCSSQMDIRMADVDRQNGTVRPILFCNECQRGLGLPQRGIARKVTPAFLCPICKFEVLEIQPGNGFEGNPYTLCPWCYHNPPEGSDNAGATTFPCFMCSKDCPLAKKTMQDNTPIAPCHLKCGNALTIRKTTADSNSNGSLKLSCSTFPACRGTIWLPRVIRTAIPEENGETCSRCGPNVRLLSVTFHRNGRPSHVPPALDRICLFCNGTIQELNSGVPLGESASRTNQTRGASNLQRNDRRVIPMTHGSTARGRIGNNYTSQQVRSNAHCKCGEQALKSACSGGNNIGRMYLRCLKGKCDFWQWDDIENRPNNPNVGRGQSIHGRGIQRG